MTYELLWAGEVVTFVAVSGLIWLIPSRWSALNEAVQLRMRLDNLKERNLRMLEHYDKLEAAMRAVQIERDHQRDRAEAMADELRFAFKDKDA
jgi:hypothetical protein